MPGERAKIECNLHFLKNWAGGNIINRREREVTKSEN